MALLNLDLQAMQAARTRWSAERDELRAQRAELAALDAERERAVREGGGRLRLAQLDARIAALRDGARAGHAGQAERLQGLKGLSEQLRAQRDPALMVTALSTAQPVLLMPVSLQTRYDNATTRLMLRIYPDVLHAVQHDIGLTPAELAAAQRYWAQRYASPLDTASPWKELATPYGPMRAAWLVRQTRPLNHDELGQPGAEPQFDLGAIPVAAAEAREVVAGALPDRFVVVGWRNGVETLRKWGAPVADWLPMSPLFDPLLTEVPAGDEAAAEAWDPFSGDRAWLVNYPAAESAGMAITVTATDLKNGGTLAQGFDRLVVLGVDWTRSPDEASALVGELLSNHQHGQGLAFVAQGTPTNNTGEVRAGFAANGADVAGALDPVAADAQAQAAAAQAAGPGDASVVADELAGAGARLQFLLGLPTGEGRFDAAQLPGAALAEGATAGHMTNALWNATLGYTLRYFWNPLDSSQRLLDDAALSDLRAHAVRYLRPGGPFSTLRVGAQPYGLLPVAARGYLPAANSPIERELHRLLGWLRGFWQAAQGRTPTLRNPAPDALHQVLAMQPWSVAKRFWRITGPAATANQPDIAAVAAAQRRLFSVLTGQMVARGMPTEVAAAFIGTCAVQPKAQSLDAVAWVQRDPAHPQAELPAAATLARDYLAALTQLLSQAQPDVRAALRALHAGESLLESLLLFAADEELLASGRRLFERHVETSPLISAAVRQSLSAQVRNFRYAEYTGVDSATLVGDQFQLGHAGALLGLQLQGTTGERTVSQFTGDSLGLAVQAWPEHLKNVATFRESIAFLQQRTVGELDLALRGTLDVAAHRLDAWITSLATKRLDQMRDATPLGLHLGAWGVLENLRPDSTLANQRAADSLGYVHAPSLQQAVATAVLRSGNLAHRGDAANAFEIDLRSHRVQRARHLLEGVANGQRLAALLGYRFERGLQEAGLPQHILDYRRQFPLNPTGAGAEVGEAIAARDVIDGVRLLEAYQRQGIGPISPASVDAGDWPGVGRVADDLVDLMDAVSDLLLAESVYQLVGGNLDGAAAAMNVLDKQTRPPETRVADTPRSRRGYTQRVVVALRGSDAGAWEAVADLAAQVEPRLNAWLARLLGDPARFRFAGRVLARVATGERYDGREQFEWQDQGVALSAGVLELGLSPLSLVLGCQPQQQGGQSAFQERLAAVFSGQVRAQFGDAADTMAVVIDAEAPADAPAGSVGVVGFESLAWVLQRLLGKARALRRMDLVLARDGVDSAATSADGDHVGVDLDELTARLAVAEAAATAARNALAKVLVAVPAEPADPEPPDPASPVAQALLVALQGALAQAHALGWRSAQSAQAAADGNAQGSQVAGGDTLRAAEGRARALLAEIDARLAAAPAPQATDAFATRVTLTLARIRAVMGADFPVLPHFALGGYAAEASASLARRSALLGGDDLAIAGWLPKLGCVREVTGLLADVLSAAEAADVPTDGAHLQLLQYGAAGVPPVRRWGALPPHPDDDLRGVVAVVVHATESLDDLAADTALAGLYLDEWMEAIPSATETTGLGFHLDAPGARAPQAMLLAVPADRSVPNWTLDELLGVVDEALALSRLRAVRPQDLQGLGVLLPGLFLSNNFNHAVPSLDFARLIEANLGQLRAAYAQNSTQSFMHMAAGSQVVSE